MLNKAGSVDTLTQCSDSEYGATDFVFESMRSMIGDAA